MSFKPVTYDELFTHAFQLGIKVIDWNDCKLGRQLGSGASMRVHEGTCSIDGAEHSVAFKLTNYSLDDKAREKTFSKTLRDVRQEIRLMGRLIGHPHVVQLLAVSFNDLNPVLILELAECNLEEYLDETKVDWPTKLRFAFEIAEGLEGVHDAGIVYAALLFCQ